MHLLYADQHISARFHFASMADLLPSWRVGAGRASETLQKPLFQWTEQIEKKKTTPKFSIAICKPSTGQAWHGNHS
jgi:hypothetical protein